MIKRPSKHANLILLVRSCVASGHYVDTYHAERRSGERRINRLEIEYVLKTGWHEVAKDKFDSHYKAWNYSLRGKTLDELEVRVIISFDKLQMLVVTVIRL